MRAYVMGDLLTDARHLSISFSLPLSLPLSLPPSPPSRRRRQVLAGLRHRSSFETVMSSFLVAEGLLQHTASFMKPRYKEVGASLSLLASCLSACLTLCLPLGIPLSRLFWLHVTVL